MIDEDDLVEIIPEPAASSATSSHIQTGVPVPKAMRVQIFSPDEWEDFIEEWATTLNGSYAKVRRLGGSGDLGVDIAGFRTNKGFKGAWDNYQCKRYDHPAHPSDVWVEIGKIVYYSFMEDYAVPQAHYFVCSQGIGTSLEKLLNKTDDLKTKAKENWGTYCQNGITSTAEIELKGELEAYFDTFDFSIFSSKSHLELIEAHSTTGYHSVRFGGGLPKRPRPQPPPAIVGPNESRYIRQLLDAYGDHLGADIDQPASLDTHALFKKDYLRQRERFYHAESLRNFARDTVPEGTFSSLQEEILSGVIDIAESLHADGFERMKATVSQAALLATTANPLSSAVKLQDRQGICHQLANEDRLTWVPVND